MHKPRAVIAATLLFGCLFATAASARYGQPQSIQQAAGRGNMEEVKAFIEKGVDLNEANRRGETALGAAVQTNRIEIVKLLLASGAKPDTPSMGLPPLVNAILRQRPDIITLLIEAKANVNAKDASGRTPLIVATESTKLEWVKLLVSKGADVNAKDNRGYTPLSIAKRSRLNDIADFLTQNGAEEQDMGYGRDPYGRPGYESMPGGPGSSGAPRYDDSDEVSVLSDPNAIAEHIAAHAGLAEALAALDANAVSVARSWASHRTDNRATLIRSVAKQVTAELNFVGGLAKAEKAAKTTEAITKLQTERKERYDLIASELRTARRLAMQDAQNTATRGRSRGSSRSRRGSSSRSASQGRYGDPAQMGDPYGAAQAPTPRRRSTTEGVPEKPVPPRTQAQMDAWVGANPEDKRGLLDEVHNLDLLEYDSLRKLAVEEKAEKTSAALEGLMLARQTRRDGILAKMAADEARQQRMAERYGTTGRGRPGQPGAQPGEQTMPRRRRR